MSPAFLHLFWTVVSGSVVVGRWSPFTLLRRSNPDDSSELPGTLTLHTTLFPTRDFNPYKTLKRSGQIMQHFDYSNEEGEREATSAACSPSAQSAAFGSYDKIRMYNYNVRKRIWEESPPKIVPNLYTITALEWKMDGTRLAAGTLCGSVELFDCALKRSTYKGKFEFTYVGPSQVIVKKLSTGIRIVLKSHYNYEINKINVLGDDQFLVVR